MKQSIASATTKRARANPLLYLPLLLVVALAPFVAPSLNASAANDDVPRYKPASRAPEPMDITSNRYGASRSAPHALGLGAIAPDFELPRAGGGMVSLASMAEHGPVAVIFYRGHW